MRHCSGYKISGLVDMPVHSKVASKGISLKLTDLLVGSRKKKMVSGTVLLIIAFLIYVKNKKSYIEPLGEPPKKKVYEGLPRAAKAMSISYSSNVLNSWSA